jgi:undecaprenyl-diphosphatase
MSADRMLVILVGFATSFVSAVLVVKAFLRFVSNHTFSAFAWYRIGFGLVLLAWYLG